MLLSSTRFCCFVFPATLPVRLTKRALIPFWIKSKLSARQKQAHSEMATGPAESNALSVRVLTWNVDMNTEYPLVRARSIVEIVRAHFPPIDVIMFQEVTSVCHTLHDPLSSHLALFRDRLEFMYDMHADERWITANNYFVLMFTRKGFFKKTPAVQVTCFDFPSSKMERTYISVEGTVSNGQRVSFITSHLESEAAGAAERKHQFATIVDMMRHHAKQNQIAIFGGDTNLRESEISATAVAKKPVHEEKEREKEKSKENIPEEKRKISDAYIQAGADEKKKFTWDMKRNDNLKVDWEFPPASRYDRVFVFGPPKRYPICTKWDLVGKTRLECDVFPSDHWGVLVEIQIPPFSDNRKDQDQVKAIKSVTAGPSSGTKRRKLNKQDLDT